MSSATSSALKVIYNAETTELGRSVGVVFVGYVLSMILYGINSYQLYIYFSTVLKERSINRWVIGLLGLLDSTSLGLMTFVVHFYMISQFPVALPAVEKATGTFCADNIIAIITIFLVQLAYAQRVHQYNNALAAVLSILALVAAGLGLVMSIQLLKNPDFNELGGVAYLGVIGTCQVITFVIAALTFVTVLFCEKTVPPSKSNLAKNYDRMISVVFEKGAAAAVIQALYLILFFSAPTDRFWILFQFVARRLFLLSLLTLYINDAVRERRCITSLTFERGLPTLEFSATVNSNSPSRKQHTFATYLSGDARNDDASVFNISVTTREVLENSETLPGK